MADDGYKPWVKRCDFAAVKRSILRYLNRYEREWGYAPVWQYGWEFSGSTPLEEDGAVMTGNRVRPALGALVREGLLMRRRDHTGRRLYALTDEGRKTTQDRALAASEARAEEQTRLTAQALAQIEDLEAERDTALARVGELEAQLEKAAKLTQDGGSYLDVTKDNAKLRAALREIRTMGDRLDEPPASVFRYSEPTWAKIGHDAVAKARALLDKEDD